MKIFTAAQIRRWDEYSILHEPVSSIQLMERAANACFQFIKNEILLKDQSHQPTVKKNIIVFCGKGNNGGDGLAIARMLLKEGFITNIYIAETGQKESADFTENLHRLKLMDIKIHFIKSASELPYPSKNDLIIDALFGTGLNKPLLGLYDSLIERINQSLATVVSIDIPSGMYADKSCKDECVVKASVTLSFQNYKIAFLFPENAAFTGDIQLLNIGLHPKFESEEDALFTLTDKQWMKGIFRPKNKFSHKGTFGHALMIAGSLGKMGAAILASNACLKTGLGLLTVQVPESGIPVIQITTPEAMLLDGNIKPAQIFDAIGAGPGLGTEDKSIKKITYLLDHFTTIISNKNSNPACCKLVLDADALNILSSHPDLFFKLPANSILTPHPKEFERLFGKTNDDFERINLALKKAAQYQCYIILKGHHSFIATPEGKGYFNNTGNAGMAKGGSGDVLSGILTSLAAQGYTALETCLLGVYIHGLAGDLAANHLSQEAMLASDISNYLGMAFKTLYTSDTIK